MHSSRALKDMNSLVRLGEEEDWERIWTDSSREYRLFGLYPRSTSGMLSMGMFAAQYATSKAGRLLTSLTR